MAEINPLKKEDFETKVWARLKEYAEGRINQLRMQNDAIQSSETATAVRRGQIAELKVLLSLDKEKPLPDNFI